MTTISERPDNPLGAIRLRSDVERKRLFGLHELDHTHSVPLGGIYSPGATARTYQQLCEHARTVGGAGFPVIVDATFLERGQRDMFHTSAHELHVPFAIVSVDAPYELLHERIAVRSINGNDASEATPAILDAQICAQESLSADELADTITIDAGNDMALAARAVSDALTNIWDGRLNASTQSRNRDSD